MRVQIVTEKGISLNIAEVLGFQVIESNILKVYFKPRIENVFNEKSKRWEAKEFKDTLEFDFDPNGSAYEALERWTKVWQEYLNENK